MKGRLIIFFLLVLTMFLSFIPLTNAETSDKFVYFIDGKNILDITSDMVIGKTTFLVIHGYSLIKITYTTINQTIYDNKTFVKPVFNLDVYDNSHLIIMDNDNNIIVDVYIHTMNIGNFFQYVFPLKYQQLAITVLLAFLVSLLLIYAFFINKVTRIL